jgi:hypothetical protein
MTKTKAFVDTFLLERLVAINKTKEAIKQINQIKADYGVTVSIDAIAKNIRSSEMLQALVDNGNPMELKDGVIDLSELFFKNEESFYLKKDDRAKCLEIIIREREKAVLSDPSEGPVKNFLNSYILNEKNTEKFCKMKDIEKIRIESKSLYGYMFFKRLSVIAVIAKGVGLEKLWSTIDDAEKTLILTTRLPRVKFGVGLNVIRSIKNDVKVALTAVYKNELEMDKESYIDRRMSVGDKLSIVKEIIESGSVDMKRIIAMEVGHGPLLSGNLFGEDAQFCESLLKMSNKGVGLLYAAIKIRALSEFVKMEDVLIGAFAMLSGDANDDGGVGRDINREMDKIIESGAIEQSINEYGYEYVSEVIKEMKNSLVEEGHKSVENMLVIIDTIMSESEKNSIKDKLNVSEKNYRTTKKSI